MANGKEIVNNVYTYGLRGMERKIRQGVPRTKFLQEHFFGGEGGIFTDQRFLKLKIKTRPRTSVEQAEWNSKGHILANDNGYAYKIVEVPYFYDRHVVEPDELDQLDFDEDPANPLSYDEKLMLVLQKDREELYEKQDTSQELLALEVLSSGKYSLLGGAVQDFGISPSMFVDASSDTDGTLTSAGNKAEWLTKKCTKVLEDSGVLVDEIVLPLNAVFALLGDSTIHEILDTRRLEGANLGFEKYRDDGVAYHGHLMLPGFGAVSLLTYNGRYTDASGNDQYIFPQDSILFGHQNLGNTNYGAVYRNDTNSKMAVKTAAKDFVHVVEGDGDIPSSIAVCRQTSPCFAPMVLGGWMFVKHAIA